MTLSEALAHADKCEKDGVISTSGKALITLAAKVREETNHSDDIAVDAFAKMMKAKLAKAREKGRGGWDNPAECDVETLALMLVEHVVKGDPVDIANFCMMVSMRNAGEKEIKEAVAFRFDEVYASQKTV
jgi:hypothetical protein